MWEFPTDGEVEWAEHTAWRLGLKGTEAFYGLFSKVGATLPIIEDYQE
jgi:hypothetical protein